LQKKEKTIEKLHVCQSISCIREMLWFFFFTEKTGTPLSFLADICVMTMAFKRKE